MKYVPVFRPEVRDDLDRAYIWYEQQNLGLGDEFLDNIDAVLQRVCLVPNAFTLLLQGARRWKQRTVLQAACH